MPLGIDGPSTVRRSYGASKLQGEVAISAAAQQFGVSHSLIGYHNDYGPRMGDNDTRTSMGHAAKKACSSKGLVY